MFILGKKIVCIFKESLDPVDKIKVSEICVANMIQMVS